MSLPYEIWEGMTEQGQRICRHIVAEKGAAVPKVQWGESWPTKEEYAKEHGEGDRWFFEFAVENAERMPNCPEK